MVPPFRQKTYCAYTPICPSVHLPGSLMLPFCVICCCSLCFTINLAITLSLLAAGVVPSLTIYTNRRYPSHKFIPKYLNSLFSTPLFFIFIFPCSFVLCFSVAYLLGYVFILAIINVLFHCTQWVDFYASFHFLPLYMQKKKCIEKEKIK